MIRRTLLFLLMGGSAALGLQATGDDVIALANKHVLCTFRKGDGALLGISEPGHNNLCVPSMKTPLWSLEVLPPGASKPITIAPDAATKFSCETVEDQGAKLLKLAYNTDGAEVHIEARVPSGVAQIRWCLAVELKDKNSRLWSVTFPQIPVASCDAAPGANEMVVPYRRGQTRGFGKGTPKSDVELPYPGASAKFQFLAAYGSTSKRGLYYAAEDGAGFTKSFWLRNRPDSDAIIFAIQHFPENRGAAVQKYRMPYEVVTQPFNGDWWEAARIYRAWWVKQIWASKGLLAERKDLPDWLRRSPMAVRASTTKPERTVPNNETGLSALSTALHEEPFFGVWYGYPQAPGNAKSSDEGGLGHLLPCKPGLVDTVKRLKTRGVHLEAYIQSMIYDEALPSSDTEAVAHAVTLDAQGKKVSYGSGAAPNLLAMCRATDWWQTRLVDLSKQAVGEYDFDGVYLDSFGKGAPECFAEDHHHPVGGGNTCIAGQRQLATRVKKAIKAINPDAILSGEDPVEVFRDLLDVNLYSVNTMKNYVPIYRTVWGDYSLGHGRVLAPGRGEGLVPELAILFLEGTIPGRLYCDSPKPFLLEPAFATQWDFFQVLDRYTQHGLEYLRMGEYLHPLTLSPAPPTVEFVESAEKQKVQVPGVLHSVTRSHADGSVALVLVNITEQPQTVSMQIDPALRGKTPDAGATLSRMDEKGEFKPVASGKSPWAQKVEIAPQEVVFWVLR
jgi:hypothetical protein